MGQALYRKYRSKSLAEVVGQQHITAVLESALKKQRIGHAFLFTGPKGIGKTSTARILAHEINQLPYTDDTQHLDIIEIDAASNRRIDDIRDLREKVHIAPTSASFKVYIIDEVHMLTGESFNALLKTLEEPPAHVVFILATTEVHKLPATIISRTQRFHFRPVPLEQVVDHLLHIANKENIRIDPQALQIIAAHGEGSFRDSISLLDQLASLHHDTPITVAEVETMLGMAPGQSIQTLANAVLGHRFTEVLNQLEALEKAGAAPTSVATQLMTELRQRSDRSLQHFSLIDALLEVARSSRPQLKLMTTLAKFTHHAPPAAAAAAHTVAKVVEKATPVSPQQPAVSEPAKPYATTKDPASLPPPKVIDWEQVIDTLKKTNVPLYSVVRHAKAAYQDGTLTLYFAYDLHRKKLDNAKQTQQLKIAITELYGSSPKINTVVGAPQPKDQTAAAVAALMGGGEEVHAESI